MQSATDSRPLFSIVIPTRNEERDIQPVLDRLLDLTYPNKEILVVDDSTDRTPLIVSEYADKGVSLICGSNRGRCAARNQGILVAKGEFVIILNGDVLLPQDFLERVLAHYRQGAHYVLVESEVANTENAYARYIQALHRSAYQDADWIEWTEGFSCRKACALEAGLFPDLPFPRVSGEDGFFGMKLRAKGYRKVIDRSIVVQQIAPCHWKEFWNQRKERGQPFAKAFLDGYRSGRLLLWALGRTALYLGQVVLVVPVLCKGFRLSSYSPLGHSDFFRFSALYMADRIAFVVAGWSGVSMILTGKAGKLVKSRDAALGEPVR